ncbi:hypothetical protein HK098_007411 [Nowakowskiella sp. JEL0407]|nr:hypothetical protein HK098_007411 [Nowakowskiella sp. JEL0407]
MNGQQVLIDALNNIDAFSLLSVLQTIRNAANDPRITTLFIDLSTGKHANSLGLAQIQELRKELLQFRTSKNSHSQKPSLIIYTDTFDSQLLYHLATAADKIYMEPSGSIPLSGFNTIQPFYKKFLDRIGVDVKTYSLGVYKSVMQPFGGEKWSDPVKENMTSVLSDLNKGLMEDILKARGDKVALFDGTLDWGSETQVHVEEGKESPVQNQVTLHSSLTKKMEYIMDASPISAPEALKIGLIDGIVYKGQLGSFIPQHTKSIRGILIDGKIDTDQRNVTSFKKYHLVSRKTGYSFIPGMNTMRAVTATDQTQRKENQVRRYANVGVVYLTGVIMRGDKESQANWVAKQLSKAVYDKSVQAVVLRVDSGGGDAIASDTIWESVSRTQQLGKPVIVSFGNVAASGGYYSAAAASCIIANPGTVTGSIGVATMRPKVTEKLLDTIGVTTDEILFNEGAKGNSIFHEVEERYLERFKHHVQKMYELFKERVSTGRNKTMEEVENFAGGRIWTGSSASKVGLVDANGGLMDAIDTALFHGYNFTRTRESLLEQHQPSPSQPPQKTTPQDPYLAKLSKNEKLSMVSFLDPVPEDSYYAREKPVNVVKVIGGPKTLFEVFSSIGEGGGGVEVTEFLRGIVWGVVRDGLSAEMRNLGLGGSGGKDVEFKEEFGKFE